MTAKFQPLHCILLFDIEISGSLKQALAQVVLWVLLLSAGRQRLSLQKSLMVHQASSLMWVERGTMSVKCQVGLLK